MAAVLILAVTAACRIPVIETSYATGSSGAAATPVPPALNKAEHFAYITGYPDGEVKPLGEISREEAAEIFYRLMMAKTGGTSSADTAKIRNHYIAAAPPFTDVAAGRWSNDAITALYDAGTVQGYSDGSFQPSKPITRAEFAAIAARFDNLAGTEENKIPDQENKYPDIEDHWAVKYVNSAAEKGWVRAYGDLTFRPENTIRRCEAMMWVNDALNRRVNLAGLDKDAKQWPDNTKDKWYYEIVLEAGNTHDYERIADRPKSTERWTGIEGSPVWE